MLIRFLACLLALAAASASAKSWRVRATGRAVYDDPDTGRTRPLAQAKVEVMDADVDVNDVIAQGYTDRDGRFDLSGSGGDKKIPRICDDRCSKPDVFVWVELDNRKVAVETELTRTWTVRTETHRNADGHIDFGEFSFSSREGKSAAVLFAKANEQYDLFFKETRQPIPGHGGRLPILYPAVLSAGVPFTTDESIHWPGGDDEFRAMYHEFGHRIRHGQDGGMAHFLNDARRYDYAQHHSDEKVTNEGFAFNEGWAEYHSTLLDRIEMDNYRGFKEVPGGDKAEGNVAARLLRLADRCGGFRSMWLTLKSARIHSYGEFYAALQKRMPGCDKEGPSFFAGVREMQRKLKARADAAQQAASIQEMLARMLRPHKAPEPPWMKQAMAAAGQAASGAAALLRIFELRRTRHEAWMRDAQAALRAHQRAMPPLDASTLGAHQRRRAAFLGEMLRARVASLDATIAGLLREKSGSQDPDLHAHVDAVAARIERQKAEVRKALGRGRVPARLLPASFADAARQRR